MKRASLGAFFRKVRERANISQSEVAKRLGVSAQHVCDYEAGRREVAYERLAKLLTILAVEPKEEALVYQAYGALPEKTLLAFLEFPALWSVDPELLLSLYKESSHYVAPREHVPTAEPTRKAVLRPVSGRGLARRK